MCQGLRERHTKCVCERSMQERETEREIAKGSLRSVFYVGTIPKPELFQFLGL